MVFWTLGGVWLWDQVPGDLYGGWTAVAVAVAALLWAVVEAFLLALSFQVRD